MSVNVGFVIYNILEKQKRKEYYKNELFNELFSAGVWGDKTPNAPKWIKWIHRNLSDNHCPECLQLDGCWFLKEKTKKWPHHLFCHCVLEYIQYNDVLTKCTSDSAYSKFDIYLFNIEGRYTDAKKKLFEGWGYTLDDGKWLQSEINKQGLSIFWVIMKSVLWMNTVKE